MFSRGPHSRSGRRARSWIPRDVSGCVLWCQSDLGTTDDGNGLCSRWADQSGKGNNFTAATTARPTITANALNGHPSLRFDGSANVLTCTGTSDLYSQKFTMVILCNVIAQSGSTEIGLMGLTNATKYFLTRFNTDGKSYGYMDQGGSNNVSNTMAKGSFFAMKLIWDGTTGTNSLRLYKGATLQGQKASGGSSYTQSGNVVIGNNGGSFGNIDVIEAGFWNRDWTDLERTNYDNYVHQRYGI